jgi:hypothetical protein
MKSQLRKEYEPIFTDLQKNKEEEVVEIVNQFRKDDLNVNAKPFISQPQQTSEQPSIEVELDEVVAIIREDCQSTGKEDRTKRTVELKERNQVAPQKSSQQILSRNAVEVYNEINTRCEDTLRKVTEVKSERKRGNFIENEHRKKFQG